MLRKVQKQTGVTFIRVALQSVGCSENQDGDSFCFNARAKKLRNKLESHFQGIVQQNDFLRV